MRMGLARAHRLAQPVDHLNRFSLAIDVITRVPSLQVAGAHVKEHLRDLLIDCRQYAHRYGIDKPEMREWRWPY
jgi:xylulose-5-phosphate/fructose-6-phosphate phosphoketolase